MKIRSALLLFLATACFCYCSRTMQPSYSAEVNFVRQSAPGTIAVTSVGYGKNEIEAVKNAHTNAFNVLLFKGLPSTPLNLPLIENEKEARAKNSAYFTKLFTEETYKSFMLSSTESSTLVKSMGTKKILVDMVINYVSLRKDLEQNNVIRKLGY